MIVGQPSYTTVPGLLLMSCLTWLPRTQSALEAYGCEEGWHSFEDHCYLIVLATLNADDAKVHCEGQNANLASIWTIDEKEFITSLWQFPLYQMGFLWTGLRGTSVNSWKFDDKSSLQTKDNDGRWSMLDDVPGVPASASGKCVAFRPSGSLAFLDCTLEASAFICKRALPKVYISGPLLNYSMPSMIQPLNHEQLFERLFPPKLAVLPDDTYKLAVTDVSTEVGCAYNCFSITECSAFQISCHTNSKCTSFQCSLFSDSGNFI